jgi:DNA polymerase III epsilon subunit-like protein
MTLFAPFDTETSGLPKYSLPADHPDQPHLASFAMILCDSEMLPVRTLEYLVKPDGWKMEPQATEANGLTDELLHDEGRPLAEVLDAYVAAIEQGYVVVAYNAQFDCKVMRGELRRAGRDDLFERTKNVCAMRSTKGLTVPKANGKGGFPALSDTYRFLFKEEMPGAHGAYADAVACLRVFKELTRLGLALPPAIHYAKERT